MSWTRGTLKKKYQGASRGGYHAEIRSSNLVQIVSKIQFFLNWPNLAKDWDQLRTLFSTRYPPWYKPEIGGFN